MLNTTQIIEGNTQSPVQALHQLDSPSSSPAGKSIKKEEKRARKVHSLFDDDELASRIVHALDTIVHEEIEQPSSKRTQYPGSQVVLPSRFIFSSHCSQAAN
jgi:hypothetical protein